MSYTLLVWGYLMSRTMDAEYYSRFVRVTCDLADEENQ